MQLKVGSAAVRAHLSYLQRDAAGPAGEKGHLYDAIGDEADGKAFLQRGSSDRHQFRFIVSPEDGGDLDLRAYTRQLMERMETDLVTVLDWVAVDHADTAHPHTHIVIHGRTDRGNDLLIAQDYITEGLRLRARELATEALGVQTPEELRRKLSAEVEQARFTRIDRITVPMDRLDQAVIDHLERRLLQPERLAILMGNVLDRRAEWIDRRRSHIAELRKRATEAEARLTRLYAAIEDGVASSGNRSLKDRIAELVAIRDEAQADAERAAAALERLEPSITAEALARFAEAAREKLRGPDGAYRRDHLRAVAQRVEVISPREIKIMGSRTELLRTLAAASGVEKAVLEVRSFKPKWRARQDSNLQPPA